MAPDVRRSRMGQRPALEPAQAPEPEDVEPPPARGRPTSKIRGLSTDARARARIEAAIIQLEEAILVAVAADAGDIEGQARVAALEARVWSLRALVVTDVGTRVRCAQQADAARASMVRLERAAGAARTKRLVAIVEQQSGTATRFGRLRRAK